jgi:Amt family ammonium transporter
MKKLLSILSLVTLMGAGALTSSISYAEPAPAEVIELAAAEVDAPVEAIAAEAEAAPTVDKGDTAWMMVATLLVILMTVPGLALFYGGLVRSKNMLSILMQVLVVFSLISVAWAVYGYSLAFGSGEGLIYGDLGKLFLSGVTMDSLAATFTDGVMIPEMIFIAFQRWCCWFSWCLHGWQTSRLR